MKHIYLSVLLTESCGLAKLLRVSFDRLIAYGHSLALIHSLYLVAEYTNYVRVRSCRSLIIFSAKLLVKCAITPANVCFVSHLGRVDEAGQGLMIRFLLGVVWL